MKVVDKLIQDQIKTKPPKEDEPDPIEIHMERPKKGFINEENGVFDRPDMTSINKRKSIFDQTAVFHAGE
jgi:hypothetical protein